MPCVKPSSFKTFKEGFRFIALTLLYWCRRKFFSNFIGGREAAAVTGNKNG